MTHIRQFGLMIRRQWGLSILIVYATLTFLGLLTQYDPESWGYHVTEYLWATLLVALLPLISSGLLAKMVHSSVHINSLKHVVTCGLLTVLWGVLWYLYATNHLLIPGIWGLQYWDWAPTTGVICLFITSACAAIGYSFTWLILLMEADNPEHGAYELDPMSK